MAYFSVSHIKEKWNHHGFQRYFKNTSWMILSRIFSIIISFFTTAYIARHLGPGNFGQLSYAVSFVGIFSFIASLGIDTVLYRELIKYPEQRKEFLGSSFVIKVCAGLVAAFICILASLLFPNKDVSTILIIILSSTFVFNSFQIINHDFQARIKSKYPSLIIFTVTIILNILKIIVVALGKGVLYLTLILLLESILYALLYTVVYRKILREKISEWKYNATVAKTLLIDSFPLLFNTAFALIYSRIDQVLIKHMIDAASVGIYDAAVRVAEAWYFLPGIIVTTLFPAILNAKAKSEKLYDIRLKRITLLLIAISVGIALPTTFIAPLLIKILYGNEFASSALILQIYIWAGVGTFLGVLTTNYLIAENYRKILFFTSLIPMISNVLLNLWWIPEYGIVGSAYATLVSYMLGPLSLLLFAKTRKKIWEIWFSSNNYEI